MKNERSSKQALKFPSYGGARGGQDAADHIAQSFDAAYNDNTYRRYFATANGTTAKSISSNALTTASFAIFPNPAQDYFFIELANTTSNEVLEIYNISGKLVISEPVYHHKKLLLKNLSTGIYYGKLQGKSEVVKLVIIK